MRERLAEKLGRELPAGYTEWKPHPAGGPASSQPRQQLAAAAAAPPRPTQRDTAAAYRSRLQAEWSPPPHW
jgi:hypothetical protein